MVGPFVLLTRRGAALSNVAHLDRVPSLDRRPPEAEIGRRAPMPSDVLARIALSEVHSIAMVAELATLTHVEKSLVAKLAPARVRLRLPVVARFTLEKELTKAYSSLKLMDRVRVPS